MEHLTQQQKDEWMATSARASKAGIDFVMHRVDA